MNKKKNNKYLITSDWISGFTQADGCFSVSFNKTKYGKLKIRPQPRWILTQHIKDLELMKNIRNFLGVGFIQINRNEVNLIVSSLTDILNVIIPHFTLYPVRGAKLQSFLIFKKIAEKMKEKEHLNLKYLIQMIQLAYFSNKSSRNLTSKKELFKLLGLKDAEISSLLKKVNNNLNDFNKSLSLINKKPISLEFILGLIEGDASFNFSFRLKQRSVVPNFTIIQDLNCLSVLQEVADFFNCGKIYNLSTFAARYQVQNLKELLVYILPKLEKCKFNSSKREQFNIFVKGCNWIKTLGYQNDEALKMLVLLVYDMNKEGKNRKLTKEEYIKQFIFSKK